MPDMPCAALAAEERSTNASSDGAVSNRPLERLAYTRSTMPDAATPTLRGALLVFKLGSIDTLRPGVYCYTIPFYVMFLKQEQRFRWPVADRHCSLDR